MTVTAGERTLLAGSVWIPIQDGDGRGYGLYRRHYSCLNKSPRIRQFTGPGECLALMTPEQNALFVWDKKLIRDDSQYGLNCAVFRNEGQRLSSDLVLAAEECAEAKWGKCRMFTYVDPKKVVSANPGYCFKVAGWKHIGESVKGLHLLAKEAS